MKIGIAGPVTLRMLAPHVNAGSELPEGYKFAPMAVWVTELMARGHQVVIFTLAPEVAAPRSYAGSQLTIHVGRYRPQGRARDFFRIERQDLLAAMRTDRCDVLHAHWTYEFAWAALDAGGPVLVTAHDAPLRVLRFLPDPYRFIRVLMARHVTRRAPFMTAVSDDIASHFRRVFRYQGDLRTIPNAVGSEVFDIGAKSKPTRRDDELTFATILCGWGRLKNAAAAIRAFQAVRQVLPRARLLMFGDDYGPGDKAEQWARGLGLAEGVEFVGMVPYATLLARLHKQVDVLVHPSREEAFGMAMAEAMALGLPVIAAASAGGAVYILENGKVGMLVDVESPGEIAAAMLTLAKDPRLREQLGTTGRSSVKTRFSSEAVFGAYERLYGEIIESRGRSRAAKVACSTA